MSGQLDLFSFESQPAMPAYLDGLNEQQAAAVNAPGNQALQVLAGAGTGKTELISRRFIKLVKDFRKNGLGRPEERILVVTFTSDAAAGMRARIHQRLLDNGEEGLGPSAWISTFHQFCMRLLRSHPLEAGLAPDFTTLNALDQQVVFNRVVQGVLSGDYPDLSDIYSKFGLTGRLAPDMLSLKTLIHSGIDDVEDLLDAERLYRLVNRIKTAGLSPAEFLQIAQNQAQKLTERLKSLPVPHDPDLKSLENIDLKISAWRDVLRAWAHTDWDPVQEATDKAESSGKKLTAGMIKDTLKSLAKLYLADRTFEPITPDFTTMDAVLALEKMVISLVTAIYALYQDALLTQGVCDFDDLINHATQLLERHPALREKYRQKFEAVIVDEFQDSNASQLRLLELLVKEGAANITVVGDEKQSIYAFRFAQPENLDLIFRNGPYQKINLQTNYRSAAPVLEVANHLTAQITVRPNQALHPCEKNAAHSGEPVIWVTLDEMEEGEEGKFSHAPIWRQKEREAQFIAVEIARLVESGAYRFSDIAVLVKSHAKAEEIQKRLAGFNIPAICQKNLGFFQESVIKDSMALLRLMKDLHDDASLVRILQGRLNQKHLLDLIRHKQALKAENATISLFEACLNLHAQPEAITGFPMQLAQAVGDLAAGLQEIRKRKHRLSPAQLFLALAKRIGIMNRHTPAWQQKQQRISLRTFERLLYLFGQNQPLQPTLDEVIDVLERYAADPSQELPVKEELSGEDAVRIMTVFASKGLEFPVVFAAYTEKARAAQPGDTIVFDPQYAGKAGFGLILSKANGLANLKREVYQKCWQTPRSRTEAQRVFYVALTRAEKRLYVIRGSQSFPWTEPSDYPGAAIRIISETVDAEHLENEVWNANTTFWRERMTAIQEQVQNEATTASGRA